MATVEKLNSYQHRQQREIAAHLSLPTPPPLPLVSLLPPLTAGLLFIVFRPETMEVATVATPCRRCV